MAVANSINRRSPDVFVPVTPPRQSSESAGEFVNLTGDGDHIDDALVPNTTPESSDADGTTKMNAISVEDYKNKNLQREMNGVNRVVIDLSQGNLGIPRVIIDLTQENPDDEIQILEVKPKVSRVKAECSNSKPLYIEDDDDAMEITAPVFMCEICCDVKQMSDIFRITGCDHSYCSDCISKFVASKLQDNISRINCPVSGCEGVLEPHHCRSILPPQVFDRWGDALCEAVVLASEKFYCPFKDCSALLIDEKLDVVQSECPECRRLFCAKCKVPWHSDIACSEFQKLHENERGREDIQLMNFANSKEWKRCPNCRVYVERISGCPFMICRCKCTFCYKCGARAKDHHCYSCGT